MKKLNDLRTRTKALVCGFCRSGAFCRASVKSRGIGSRSRVRLRFGDEGQSLVEFALMVPIFLMVLTGIIEISFAMWNFQSLNQGTDAAARLLADGGETNNTNGTSILGDPCQSAFQQITNLSTGLNPNKITVTYTLNGTTIGPFAGTSANTCAGDETLLGSGNITVAATYPCNIFGYRLTSIFAGCQLAATKTELAY
ncbi:MAG: TadE/TadG family type IV pilus assembly protein [Terracidiphilus sp.]